MKRIIQIVFIIIACAAMTMAQPAQTTNLTTDILGAHLVYGRGCVACHAPHSGPAGNNAAGVATSQGNLALWGQNLTPLYGQTLAFGGGSYSVTLPASATAMPASAGDPTNVILFCLSCHDGNLAKPGMMKGVTVETLPVVGGNAPTFLGNDGSGGGNYANDHPVGPAATMGCGGQYNWDCTISAAGAVQMTGPNSSVFVKNYGFTVSPALANGSTTPVVTCTTCHNQHSNTIYAGTIGNVKGYYSTMFFVRGYYNPNNGGNSVAQFCRNCHGGEANESNGQYSVPTI
jgi:cytochrome c553